MSPRPPPSSITWEHGGEKVYLTGTFDNWQRTIEMTKLENGTFFHELSSVVLPVEYKFVVDGNWQYDVNQPIKSDNEGNVNNWVHAGLLRH
ncbi:hypothetical protein DM01DRAFT_1116726 [Hesseltinella vesiculosa]|uniref:AMP-activated protein kinase glycogen-binding domain-containing protein n=1 Tax=Hesseltinella vesiculosa TaxID=101127 RepID=A0A1X2G9J4_9FUNG|nr:hypothetical protein DM01DRAFT_1116726 [Hesseltinella vesiculosa]